MFIQTTFTPSWWFFFNLIVLKGLREDWSWVTGQTAEQKVQRFTKETYAAVILWGSGVSVMKNKCSIYNSLALLRNWRWVLGLISSVAQCLRAYVRKIYVRKWNRGNAWKVARERKSWTSLNFTFNLNTLYPASILFTWLKFTCFNVRGQKCVSGNQL